MPLHINTLTITFVIQLNASNSHVNQRGKREILLCSSNSSSDQCSQVICLFPLFPCLGKSSDLTNSPAAKLFSKELCWPARCRSVVQVVICKGILSEMTSFLFVVDSFIAVDV